MSDPRTEVFTASDGMPAIRMLSDDEVIAKLKAENERMADALWAISDGDTAPPVDRIIARGGLGDRFDHSKPYGR